MRLRHKLRTSPLSTLVTEASSTLVAKPWTDAVKRINDDFPEELRNCAVIRAEVEHERCKNDQKHADEIAKLLGEAIEKTESLREKFKKTDADFRDYVLNAKRRFDQALAITKRVADTKQYPLTDAENLSIHSKQLDGSIDTALQTKRNAAAAARKTLATAQIDVDAKQTAVDIAILNAKATDIDKDPNTDKDVVISMNALTIAQTNLAGARTAFKSFMQTDLTDWETAVPDTAWRNLADFEEAKRLLIDLKKAPASKVIEMDKAEADLVASLQEADKKRKKLELLKSEAQKAATKLSFDTGILPRRVLSALRGDS